MNYYFTGILIILFLLLASFVRPAEARNEYLNNGSNECRYGDVDLRIEKEDRDTNYTYSDSDHDSENYRLSLNFRKYFI